MPALADSASGLQARLDDLLAEHGVPGASVGILRGDDELVVASGLANVGTGVTATPDTLFQIGSISKLYTTTVVAQLVDQGLVELDSPVRASLNEFRVADDAATFAITPRHLLSHTSGIEGDHFIDCGRNPDALWRFVSTLDEIGQIHAPDDLYSYCNTGFAVAGRLVEEVTGTHFARALRRRLLKPMGLRRTVVTAEHAIIHRVAAGHRQPPDAPPEVQPWTLGTFNIPMGGVLAPAAEVLEFARLHLRHGKTRDGKSILPASMVSSLQEPQIEQPGGVERALGWEVHQWGDQVVIGHDGDTLGQRAFLRVIPESDGAIVVLTNSYLGPQVATPLLTEIAADIFDLPVPPLPVVDLACDVDATRLVGSYERMHQRLDIEAGEGNELLMRIVPDEWFRAGGSQDAMVTLRPCGDDLFRGLNPESGTDALACFVDPEPSAGPPGYLHWRGRAHRRLED